MPTPRDAGRRAQLERGQTAVDGVLALMVVLLVVQMWTLTAALESFLAGHPGAAIPGAVFSIALFLANAGLYRLIGGLRGERRPRRR
jgi:hypothetical protein